MRFVELNLTDGNPIFINLNLVSDMLEQTNQTVLSFAKEDYYLTVKQTPKQILFLIDREGV